MTGDIGNAQLESHHCLVSDQKPQKAWWPTYVDCVDPSVCDKIKMPRDTLQPSARTQQSHAQVMPHLSFRMNARIQNYVNINCWILNVVTLEPWKTHKKQYIFHRWKHRDSHKTKGPRVTTWPKEPRGSLRSLENCYFHSKSQQFDNPKFRSASINNHWMIQRWSIDS